MSDKLPFAPRIDLWYTANVRAGTIPKKHAGRSPNDIARAEGWALHKVNPEYQNTRKPEDNLHWGIGVLSFKETTFTFRFSPDVGIEVEQMGKRTRVVYHTPVGSVSSTIAYSDAMRRAGASNFWIDEYVIKDVKDYRAVGYIFENLELIPEFHDYVAWSNEIGEDGLAVTMAGRAASPMHHIQKYFFDATDFYYHYHDYQKEMRALAERMQHFFDQTLRIVADSPAEVAFWGANFDDMITHPAYFEKEIAPWIGKAADLLGSRGKFLLCHCDGENLGLMDLIRDSGMHIAEAICPHPMTKVTIEEYYSRWSKKLTLFGGIPSILLLAESTTDAEFEAYLDRLFSAVAPGTRMILGVADSVPPNAVFDRLVRIGERVEQEGRLPLEAGVIRPMSEARRADTAARQAPQMVDVEGFQSVREDVFKGSDVDIPGHVEELLSKGVRAHDILQHGLLSAMELIGRKMASGELFIPEVLLSARAMNKALSLLEPHFQSDDRPVAGKVLIGTVRGDLHDIGKNMVGIMLRGVGFEIRDMGINVVTEEILKHAAYYKPDILGLSALLTTTMPEMRTVINALEQQGLRNDVMVMVGGAPVNEKFARDIGADGYAPDAGEAISLAKKLMEQKNSRVHS